MQPAPIRNAFCGSVVAQSAPRITAQRDPAVRAPCQNGADAEPGIWEGLNEQLVLEGLASVGEQVNVLAPERLAPELYILLSLRICEGTRVSPR